MQAFDSINLAICSSEPPLDRFTETFLAHYRKIEYLVELGELTAAEEPSLSNCLCFESA